MTLCFALRLGDTDMLRKVLKIVITGLYWLGNVGEAE
jgi:hypothetical protein